MFVPDSTHNAVDMALRAFYLTSVFALPLWGYVFMVADLRAYLRKMRGVLIRIRDYATDRPIPAWATVRAPRSLRSLGLSLPCAEEDVLDAYRRRVKTLHPDLGGDRRLFLRLQADFEAALEIVRESAAR